jgi:hypothetical protein
VTSAAHNKPSLVQLVISSVLSQVYANTAVVQELIHTVEMGPFKHRVDDGLETRKVRLVIFSNKGLRVIFSKGGV